MRPPPPGEAAVHEGACGTGGTAARGKGWGAGEGGQGGTAAVLPFGNSGMLRWGPRGMDCTKWSGMADFPPVLRLASSLSRSSCSAAAILTRL